jgi:hypothetical protein
MWKINFATGFFTPVNLPRLVSTTLMALGFVVSIQRSNAFVIPNQHPFIHLYVFLQKVTGVLDKNKYIN